MAIGQRMWPGPIPGGQAENMQFLRVVAEELQKRAAEQRAIAQQAFERERGAGRRDQFGRSVGAPPTRPTGAPAVVSPDVLADPGMPVPDALQPWLRDVSWMPQTPQSQPDLPFPAPQYIPEAVDPWNPPPRKPPLPLPNYNANVMNRARVPMWEEPPQLTAPIQAHHAGGSFEPPPRPPLGNIWPSPFSSGSQDSGMRNIGADMPWLADKKEKSFSDYLPGEEASRNLLEFGLAMMAAGEPQPGATVGPTFMGAAGRAGLQTLGSADKRLIAGAEAKHKKSLYDLEVGKAEETKRANLATEGLTGQRIKADVESKAAAEKTEAEFKKITANVSVLRAQLDSSRLDLERKREENEKIDHYEKALKRLAEDHLLSMGPPDVYYEAQKAAANRIGVAFKTDPGLEKLSAGAEKIRNSGKPPAEIRKLLQEFRALHTR